ncbi:TPA: DNA polymerase III subunit theta [Yersinia enterocolitica]|nr:DNA polymerase III subunit theta [Yersinia enterocolitica]EKN5934463.1 hypothetical protein [Yersinia enterocolitica]HDL7348725.1 hypothetical protein [Yersinia enterocolitica]
MGNKDSRFFKRLEEQQPEHLREYFRERVKHYREVGRTMGKMEYTPPERK